MELNGGGKKNNNVEPTRQTELNIAEASASSVRELPLGEESMQQMSSKAGENIGSESYPVRPGEQDCPHYLNSGYCRLGMSCEFNHRPMELVLERMKAVFPETIGLPVCQHYQETNPGIIRQNQFNALGYPLRTNAMDCKFYLLNGWCKFNQTCRFNHPEPSNSLPWWRARTTPSQTLCPGELTSFSASSHWQGPSSYAQVIRPQGLAQVPSWNTFPQQNSGNNQFVGSGTAIGHPASYSSFPDRPGEPDCPFFGKTGDCKFGSGCRFNHPIGKMYYVLSPMGLPLRPGQPTCAFYGLNGFCGYGTRCKFDHPIAAPKGITDSLSTSSSDVPVVQQPLESSSGPAKLTLSSESCPVASPGKTPPLVMVSADIAAPKGITDSPSTSSSDVPVVQQPLESSSGPAKLTLSSESCPVASPGKTPPLVMVSADIAAPKGITDSPSTSSSDVPVVQQPLESSSGPATLTLSSERSPVASPGKFEGLPSSNPKKMNSDDENVKSE